MDIMSITGIFAAAALLIYGMVAGGGELNNFFDIKSAAIVLGGTLAALMIIFPLKSFASLPKLIIKIFTPKQFDPRKYISDVVAAAYLVKKDGLLSLEDMIPEYKDVLMRKGIQLAVDSTEPEEIREILETELGYMTDRHKAGVQFFEKGAVLAPGFGMLGTLVGLINILIRADNPEGITVSMAAALITTFYGLILANIIFLPMGNKLQRISEDEVLCKKIIIEGITAIMTGESPKQIYEKLTAYVTPAMRNQIIRT